VVLKTARFSKIRVLTSLFSRACASRKTHVLKAHFWKARVSMIHVSKTFSLSSDKKAESTRHLARSRYA
jgi:hypothetical protein